METVGESDVVVREWRGCDSSFRNLANNRLTGTVPPEIFDLPYLSTMYGSLASPDTHDFRVLGHNRLSGTLADYFWKETTESLYVTCGQVLTTRFLTNNSFTGTIPNAIEKAINLINLWVSFYPYIGHRTYFKRDLSTNQLTGTIPVNTFKLTKLSHLYDCWIYAHSNFKVYSR